MSDLNLKELEDLRRSVLAFLCHRPGLAFTKENITGRVIKSNDLDFVPIVPQIEAALSVLSDLGYVTQSPDPLGSTRYWRATAAGVLAFERAGGVP